MKKMILAVATLALAGASVQDASAGDREWSTAGKVLTGVLAARVVADVLAPPRVYTYQSAPVYAYQPQVVYAAPQVVYTTPQVVTAAPAIANAPMVPPAPAVQPAPASTVVAPAGTVTYQSAPAPVYVQQPAPTVVYAAPAYVPPPVVVYEPGYYPSYYYRPGISVGFSFGHGGYRHGRR